ncbi:hypothetical protein V3C99_017830 [Haemonchus contortus]|uniref:RT_RNaseH domain-containing protein n=1 Tax=Haemonchus contortus TaxID=6289 RepID=A0A7I4Z6L6_HAECO
MEGQHYYTDSPTDQRRSSTTPTVASPQRRKTTARSRRRLYRFVHERHFTLKTDHEPSVAIFRSKKGTPVYNANRLQRWATMLLNYNFAIEYVNTKDFRQVGVLSRLIASRSSTPEDYVIAT